MTEPQFVAYRPPRPPIDDVATRARAFYEMLDTRRSVRMFSPEPVPRSVIDDLIRAASTAPSGAHRQPWCFVVVGDADTKRRIREAAEAEEAENYGGRLPEDWLDALAPLGTDEHKPYLETAPWLVVLFEERYGINPDGTQRKNFYVKESVGIAAGVFVAAVHSAGLATLPHTPESDGLPVEGARAARERAAIRLIPGGLPGRGLCGPGSDSQAARRGDDRVRSWSTRIDFDPRRREFWPVRPPRGARDPRRRAALAVARFPGDG